MKYQIEKFLFFWITQMEEREESEAKKLKTEDVSTPEIRICKHILEKKKRRCKFNALKNLDYCVAHLAFNPQAFPQPTFLWL